METLAAQPDIYSKEKRAAEARYDAITQLSELLDGSMLTSFELSFDGHELYGPDGRALGEVADKAAVDARRIVKQYPQLWFEVRRRSLESEEVTLARQMAKGELPNTMVIISDYPFELMDATEDLGGYNATRKQAMLRVLALQTNGNVQMYSQTLDRSDREGLEAIYEVFSEKPEAGELLGQRIHRDLSASDQETLVARLTGVYDRSMTAQYGGEWYAGRRPADYRNTYNFVLSQDDLVDECVRLRVSERLTDSVMYDMAATMQKRFSDSRASVVSSMPRFASQNQALLYQEMFLAGQKARQAGQSFSACGATLRAGGLDESTENQLEQAGYGNKTSEETKYTFDKKMHCVVCQSPPKKGDGKKMCGPCGICRNCDAKFKK